MIDVTPWQFSWCGADLLPLDEALDRKAARFCKHFLVGDFDPRQFQRVWIAHEGDRILGVCGMQSVLDVSLLHYVDESASHALMTRVNGHLADSGMRGNGVLVCSPIKGWGAQPAERYTVTVR